MRSSVFALTVSALLAFVVGPSWSWAQPGDTPAAPPALERVEPIARLHGPVPLMRVVDGDTIVVESNIGPRTVRLIGIDAPELESGERSGREAQAHLARLLEPGELLWLEFDLGLEDIYGRLLAYVYVEDPEGAWRIGPHRVTQVNLHMAQAGWARTMDIAPNSTYSDLYEHAQTDAMTSGIGMWAADEPATVFTPTGAISIACVLYNPVSQNDFNSEIVFLHLAQDMDTRGYFLYDEGSAVRLPLPLGTQPAGELQVLNPGQGIWNNGGDTIFLMVGDTVVDSWTYEGGMHPTDTVLCRDGTVR